MSLPPPALVFRRVPPGRRSLARAFAPGADDTHDAGDTGGTDGTWWELVDVAEPAGAAPAGVALTCSDTGGVAHVLVLAAVGTADDDALPRLLLELVAALRCTDAVAVEVRARRPEVRAQLEREGAVRVGDRLVLRF